MILISLIITLVMQAMPEAPFSTSIASTKSQLGGHPQAPGPREYAVRYVGHHGVANLSLVPKEDLPQLFLDEVPWDVDLGHFWVGDLDLPSLGNARCFLHESAAGTASGWVRAPGYSASIRNSLPGSLEMWMDTPSMPQGQGCASNIKEAAVASGLAPHRSFSAANHCGARPLLLAIETDTQFSDRFASVEEAAVWMTLQVLVAKDVLDGQLEVDLQVPYLGLHLTDDVWQSPDRGATAQELLGEFSTLWPAMAPTPTHLSHYFSGVGNGTSLADQDGICAGGDAFAVHTMRLDRHGQPDARVLGMAFLHGLGHNLGARHTHDYCPPLDSCNPQHPLGACQKFSDCSALGTIMSFCHLCPGGLDRVDLSFHPVNVAAILEALNACLPRRAPVVANAPSTRRPGEDWVVQIATRLQPMEAPLLRYWGASGSGEVAMMPISPGRFEGRIPPAGCGDVTHAQVAFASESCGDILWPESGIAPPMENRVTELRTQFSDSFQFNRGWTSLQGGALTGFWTRAIPVADPNWTIAPHTDAGGDGWCFLTGNYYGNSDVDNGTVELISPPIPVVSDPLQIEFAYFLGMVNENGEDRLTLECSWSGMDGPWIPVWRAGHDTHGEWEQVTLTSEYLAHWPYDLPATLHLRFLARDGSPPSVIEAAVDSLVVSTGQCP